MKMIKGSRRSLFLVTVAGMQNDIKLIIFDLNATLIDADTWPKLNQALGMSDGEDSILWKLNNEGILPIRLWAEIVNNLYRKRGRATRKLITDILLDFSYVPGAAKIMEDMKRKYTIALVSGDPDILLEHIAHDLDIDLHGSNALMLFDERDMLSEMVVLNEEPLAKVLYLQEFCRRLELKPTEVACVGDGANDIELFKRTGKGITFTDSEIKEYAWKVIPDLRSLATIL